MLLVFNLLSLILSVNCEFYDTYFGNPISSQTVRERARDNTTFWCVQEVDKCDPDEGRRIDGSCNNLKDPARGAPHTPFLRLLPAEFNNVDQSRKSSSGKKLPLARRVRTTMLPEGKVPNIKFSTLLANYLVFSAGDYISNHDTINMVIWRPYCCKPEGRSDPFCVPQEIPKDDPVHRFSGNRCLNLTKPLSYQSQGCLENGTVPERISSTTPLFDLSMLYGTNEEKIQNARLGRHGLLIFETDRKGRIWPPSIKSPKLIADICLSNRLDLNETRCHNLPELGTNSLLGINLFTIWFFRLHNLIANNLAKINPCWDDDKTFCTARDINIAVFMQIFYYELLPALMGKDNLLRDGVISSSCGFRDIYNDGVSPQISLEFPAVMRWIHTIQEGDLVLYNTEGKIVDKVPYVNMTLRTGYLAKNDNLDFITQGSFRHAGAEADHLVDPDIAELGMGPLQELTDLTTSDLAKNRLFGFAPYVKYLEFCRGKSYESFDDLLDVIDPQYIDLLKLTYESVLDIDLQAGLYAERLIEGGSVPSTFYCVAVEQLTRSVYSDRHWYERPNRPNAFTKDQLSEIRKSTLARLLCFVGDSVTKIQPKAFERISKKNELTDCKRINLRPINFNVWKDSSC